MDLPTAENCTLLWNKTLNINEINDQLNIGSCGLQVASAHCLSVDDNNYIYSNDKFILLK